MSNSEATNLEVAVHEWLNSKRSTLWGRAFEIKGNSPSIRLAVEWFAAELEDFRQFVKNYEDEDGGSG